MQRVGDYHLTHAGVSRYVKFKVWQEQFLGITYTEADGERLSTQFSRLVVERIVAAPYVTGALEFLDAYSGVVPLYVASGTPTDELHEIIKRRNMTHYFAGIYGTPDTKGAILKSIVRGNRYATASVVMIGDAMADLDGAKEAGIPFVGRDMAGQGIFPSGTPIIKDLSQLESVLRLTTES